MSLQLKQVEKHCPVFSPPQGRTSHVYDTPDRAVSKESLQLVWAFIKVTPKRLLTNNFLTNAALSCVEKALWEYFAFLTCDLVDSHEENKLTASQGVMGGKK